jgi:hypothetical protein
MWNVGRSRQVNQGREQDLLRSLRERDEASSYLKYQRGIHGGRLGKEAQAKRVMECGHAACHQCAWNSFNDAVAPYWKIDIIVRNPTDGSWKVRAYATEHLDYSAWRLKVGQERYLYAEADLIGRAIELLMKKAVYEMSVHGEISN